MKNGNLSNEILSKKPLSKSLFKSGFRLICVDQFRDVDDRIFYWNIFEPHIKLISKHRDRFIILTFLDEQRLYWTDEELRNLFDSDIIIDIVYCVTRNINGLCMLFRMNYKSRHLYVEILYFEETHIYETMQKSSVIVTYSVQRFLDHIVSNYNHKDIYSCNWRNETWEVEDRDFIYENILVCRAIKGGNIDY
jgi:hypothetical protein